MGATPILGIPTIETQQAQPEITHNEAVYLLQLALMGAISLGDNAPPGSPAEGDVYVLGSAPTGAWTGKANKIAIRFNGAWRFVPGVDSSGSDIPIGADQSGLMIFNQDDDLFYVWTGAAWTADYDASNKVDRSGDTMSGRLDILTAANAPSPPADTAIHIAGARTFVSTAENAGGAGMICRRVNGSFASPSALSGGNGILSFGATGHDGSSLQDDLAAQILALASEDWTPTTRGTRWEFRVTPVGTNTLTPALRIEPATSLTHLPTSHQFLTQNGLLRSRVFTVATLPAANISAGDMAYVTDANATTIGGIVAGGGANRVPVNYDGANWRIG